MEDRRAHERLDNMEKRLSTLEVSLDENTKATQSIASDTADIVNMLKGAKGIRTFVVWFAPIGALVVTTWSFLKDHWK